MAVREEEEMPGREKPKGLREVLTVPPVDDLGVFGAVFAAGEPAVPPPELLPLEPEVTLPLEPDEELLELDEELFEPVEKNPLPEEARNSLSTTANRPASLSISPTRSIKSQTLTSTYK